MPGAAREREVRQSIRTAIRVGRLDRKCRPDVGTRIENHLPVGRPRRIKGVLLYEARRRAAAYRYVEETRHPVDYRGHRNRLAVRRPGWPTLQFQRARVDANVRAIQIYDVKARLSAASHRKCDAAAVTCDGRTPNDAALRCAPYLGSEIARQHPDAVGGALGGDVEQKTGPESWRGTVARCQ